LPLDASVNFLVFDSAAFFVLVAAHLLALLHQLGMELLFTYQIQTTREGDAIWK